MVVSRCRVCRNVGYRAHSSHSSRSSRSSPLQSLQSFQSLQSHRQGDREGNSLFSLLILDALRILTSATRHSSVACRLYFIKLSFIFLLLAVGVGIFPIFFPFFFLFKFKSNNIVRVFFTLFPFRSFKRFSPQRERNPKMTRGRAAQEINHGPTSSWDDLLL